MISENPKRILIFCLTYLPTFVGGAELAVHEITKRLPSDRYTFDLITLRLDRTLPSYDRIGAVTIHRIGPSKKNISLSELGRFPWYLVKILYVPLAFLKALELTRVHRFDALWSIMTNMGFPGVLYKYIHPNIPYILTLQDGDTEEHIAERKRIKLFRFIFKRIFSKADAIQAISTYLAKFAKKMGYPGKVVVVPNGVDLSVFHRELVHANQDEFRHRLGIKPGYRILLTASRLVKKNAVDDIVRSLAHLPKNVALIIAGSGPDEPILRVLVQELNVSERVSFLGHVPHEELAVLFSIADIFVRPSRSEGMGSSFIEAMAAGVPIIATSVGGITDFLFDPSTHLGKVTPTGLFCKVNDPEDLAEKVRYYLKNEHFRHEVAENGKRLAREQYDWNLIARDMSRHVFEPILRKHA